MCFEMLSFGVWGGLPCKEVVWSWLGFFRWIKKPEEPTEGEKQNAGYPEST